MDNQFTPPENDVPQASPTTQVQQTAVPAQPKRSRLPWLIAVLFAVLLAAGGVYLWQHQQVRDLQNSKTTLTKQLTSTKSQLNQAKLTSKALVDVADKAEASKTASTDISTSLAPGEAYNKTNTTATVSGIFDPAANLTAIWLEYGTSPTTLSKSTDHYTKELGLGDAGTFADAGFNLTQLESGKRYFFRVAATTSKDSKTIYSGVASFTALK
jgi:cytoskeletal protein RodZ